VTAAGLSWKGGEGSPFSPSTSSASQGSSDRVRTQPSLGALRGAPPRCVCWGKWVVCKPLLPLPTAPTSFRRARAGSAARSWLSLDAISTAELGSWLEAIFSLGPQACPLVLSPHSRPVKPHPAGLPTDHAHAQGTARVLSQRGGCGVTPGEQGAKRELLAKGAGLDQDSPLARGTQIAHCLES
jgi:hypothetical protein